MIVETIGEKEIGHRKIQVKYSVFLSIAFAFTNFVIIYEKLPGKLSVYGNALNGTL